MRPGDIVAGKYRVTRVLGRSRGFLLEARHTEFDQHVVIRLMSPSLCDEKELERFRREARTLSKLESEVGKDEIHRAEEKVQKVTDEHVAQIDAALKQREADVMEV